MKQIFRYPLLLCFGAFILVLSIWDVAKGDRSFSEFENRYLQQQPKFSVKKLLDNTYTQDYEKYINDQFVLRDEWIALKSMGETALLKVENNGIVFGQDGYLFEKVKTIDEVQLEKNIDFVQRFLEAYPDLPVRFGLIPNSYEVLSDKVPYGLGNVNQSQRIPQIVEKAQEGNRLAALDLLTPLKTATAQLDYLYYRTDHHWTTTGAYVGYAAYMEVLGRTPLLLSEMEGETPVPDFYGTYYSKAKRAGTKPDIITYYDIPVTEVVIDGKPQSSYYDVEKFSQRDKYAAFLRGNNSHTVLKSAVNRDKVEGETSKILVVKDSYGNSLVPFLLYHFDEVHVVDLRSTLTPMSSILQANTFTEVLILYNFMNFSSDTNIYRLTY